MEPLARPSRKVLVLGSDTRAFLSVVRSLGRRGLEVHSAWCDPASPAARSRYVRAAHVLPPPSTTDLRWRDALLPLLARERFDLVVPCNDPAILPLQLHQDRLEPFTRSIYLLAEHAFRVAFDKLESFELARALGLRVPPHARVAVLEDLAPLLPGTSFPVVVKPRASYTLDRLDAKHHVRWARTPDELARHVEALLPWGPVAVEERCPGRGVGVEVLAHEGAVLVAFQHERVHEPPGGGGSSYRRSADLHPELLEATRRFLAALRYTGVAMVEFKLDAASGRWAFIEVNARFWGSLPLAVAAGADFPYYLYQLWVDGVRTFPQGYRRDVYCRNLVRDLAWAARTWRADPTDATVTPVPRHRIIADFVPLLTLREHSDTFVRDDPRPGCAELWRIARAAAGAVARAATRAVADLLLSRTSRSRGRRRHARRALREAPRVLFVCKGNICRSPFAERVAAAMLGAAAEVFSRGYHPEPGRPCPPAAVRVAAAMGVDLRDHRSRILSAADLDAADVVFVFDRDNHATLRVRFPRAISKVYLLGALTDDGPAVIPDPYGGSDDDFRRAYDAIRRCLVGALEPPGGAAAAGVAAASDLATARG